MINTENIVNAIEESFIDYLQLVANNGNRPFFYDNQIGWVKTFPTTWSNFIFYANLDYKIIDDQIAQICSKMKNGDIPDVWVVGPKSNPDDLGDHLEKHNITKQYSMAGMAIDITKIDNSASIPNGYHIEIVDTKEKMQIWADVVSKGLWNGEAFEDCLFENLISNPKYKFYLAYINETAVATSMLMLTHGVAEINMVSTIKNYQNLGIGTAMTITPLLYAKENGYHIGVLQASQAGEPVYRKIGFNEYCRFHVYKYQII